MRFLANENFPLASALLLQQEGHDVLFIAHVDSGAKDAEILQRARNELRFVLTFDRDYGELIYRQNKPTPPGVIYFRFDPTTPKEPAELLVDFCAQAKSSGKRNLQLSSANESANAPYRSPLERGDLKRHTQSRKHENFLSIQLSFKLQHPRIHFHPQRIRDAIDVIEIRNHLRRIMHILVTPTRCA